MVGNYTFFNKGNTGHRNKNFSVHKVPMYNYINRHQFNLLFKFVVKINNQFQNNLSDPKYIFFFFEGISQ